MKQEDFNGMMRLPGERNVATKTKFQHCPNCGYSYCGNGVDLCVECLLHDGHKQDGLQRPAEPGGE